jgi:putative ABC transport system permease protein
VLKVLGGRRRQLMAAFAVEFGLIGVATAAVAAILGSVSAWLLMTWYMRVEFTLLPGTVLVTATGAALAVMILGLAGTWRALGQRPAPLLRNP